MLYNNKEGVRNQLGAETKRPWELLPLHITLSSPEKHPLNPVVQNFVFSTSLPSVNPVWEGEYVYPLISPPHPPPINPPLSYNLNTSSLQLYTRKDLDKYSIKYPVTESIKVYLSLQHKDFSNSWIKRVLLFREVL